MLHEVESNKSVGEIVDAFEDVAQRHKLGVLGTHNLRQKMNEKGVDFDSECVIVEVCNPQKATQVLDAKMEISTALPCRVSVYEEDGKTKIATLRPTTLLDLLHQPELKTVAEEIERSIFGIMEDLA